jgi:GNAT superfamily N-acetyltransferase
MHAEVNYYLAYKENEAVGRIALIVNERYTELHGKGIGQFGFFDCIDNKDVALALFSELTKDARNFGLSELTGPTNFSFNDSIGLLVEGFTTPPFYEMPHNKPYYESLLIAASCLKDLDLLAYYSDNKSFPDRFIKAAPVLANRFLSRGIHIRNINMNDFGGDIELMRQVYNNAWVGNQGFVPVDQNEWQFYFKKYKEIIDPELVFLACENEHVIGFLLCVPNMNEIYSSYSNGNQGLISRVLKPERTRRIRTVRIMAIGVEEGYRTLGIDSYFLTKMVEKTRELGYAAGEASRILESNEALVNAMVKMDAVEYKRYRLYRLNLS